ncbi:Hypothetical_protein [Hexamita inflata]|uniref:Hypothetical_protein n=1 Tax=Hexamita inflata TaxID=28002 RepID=A0AA86TF90_9EUKA|nr:Hypothetical protein HINF_LOCUS3391 [Hexamita inflata]CAI9956830.1 Hypothetical protein HINF_LOCUS44475 [Hexamita inflata]
MIQLQHSPFYQFKQIEKRHEQIRLLKTNFKQIDYFQMDNNFKAKHQTQQCMYEIENLENQYNFCLADSCSCTNTDCEESWPEQQVFYYSMNSDSLSHNRLLTNYDEKLQCIILE